MSTDLRGSQFFTEPSRECVRRDSYDNETNRLVTAIEPSSRGYDYTREPMVLECGMYSEHLNIQSRNVILY